MLPPTVSEHMIPSYLFDYFQEFCIFFFQKTSINNFKQFVHQGTSSSKTHKEHQFTSEQKPWTKCYNGH